MFFQLDHEAFFTLAKVGPDNVMFYDMIRGQYDRLLCSVQKKKKKKKNVKKKKEQRAKKQIKQKEQLKFNHKNIGFINISNNTLPLISSV